MAPFRQVENEGEILPEVPEEVRSLRETLADLGQPDETGATPYSLGIGPLQVPPVPLAMPTHAGRTLGREVLQGVTPKPEDVVARFDGIDITKLPGGLAAQREANKPPYKPDARQLGELVEVDEHLGPDEAEVQEGDQALASGQRLGLLAVATEQGEGVCERRGRLVVEPWWLHSSPIPERVNSLVIVVRATSRPLRTTCAGGRCRVSASFTPTASHTSRSPASPGASP